MKKILVVLSLFLLFIIPNVDALTFAYTPSKVILDDIVKGQEYIEEMTLTALSDDDITLLLEATGEQKDWVTIYNEDLSEIITSAVVPKNGKKKTMVKFNVPQDTPNGEYVIRLTARRQADDVTSGSGVELVVSSVIKLSVTGNQIISADVRSISTNNVESGKDLRIKVDIENTGNVRVQPTITTTILKNGAPIESFADQSAPFIPPSNIEVIETLWQTSGRGTGDFEAQVKVVIDGNTIKEEKIPFTIFERGTLSATGNVENIDDPKKISVGTLTKLSADFYNRGEIDVSARLIGEVFLDGVLVSQLQGDEILVETSNKATLSAYFTPEKKGDYVIKRSVLFEGKKVDIDDLEFTLEKSGSTLLTGAAAKDITKSGQTSYLLWGLVMTSFTLLIGAALIIFALLKTKKN